MPSNHRRTAFEYQLLRRESDVLGQIFDHTPIPILVMNHPHVLLKVNAAALQLIKTRSMPGFAAWFEHHVKKILGAFQAGDAFVEHEAALKDAKGVVIDLLVRIKEVNKKQIIITLQDITVRKNAEKKLTRLAQLDGLTGLLNHKTIVSNLEQELVRSKRYHLPLSCLLVDVDNFKSINDRFGHLKGDQILKKVAKTLKATLRETDLVGRYGGDEFLVILTETTMDQAHIPAKRIQNYLLTNPTLKQRDLVLTFSIGISGFPHQQILTSKRLIAAADKGLYMSKKNGGNKIVVLEKIMKV